MEYYRLALLQYVLYQHHVQEIATAEEEIIRLKDVISSKQKKHRRSDKEITKDQKVSHFLSKLVSRMREVLCIRSSSQTSPQDQA